MIDATAILTMAVLAREGVPVVHGAMAGPCLTVAGLAAGPRGKAAWFRVRWAMRCTSLRANLALCVANALIVPACAAFALVTGLCAIEFARQIQTGA